MRYLSRCKVTGNEKLRNGFFLMGIDAPPVARAASPGHFILLRSKTPGWPYLRRPFSIYSADGEANIEIVYKVVGRATSIMARMLEGDEIEITGPLGHGFGLKETTAYAMGIAGGAGLPPIAFYCQKYTGVLDRVTLVIGAKTVEDLLVPTGLVVQGVELRPYTEDGSKGEKGTAVDGLIRVLGESETDPSSVQVIACGPREMLADVAGVCKEAGIQCEVSVEETMACGVGACLACAIPSSGGGYLHACHDGPVLDSQSIDWDRWLVL